MDAPTLRASVEHGPGWDTDRGRRLSTYLRTEEEVIGLVLDASAATPWLVVVTGEVDAVRAFGGAPPAGPEAQEYESGVMLPDAAFEALATREGEAYAAGCRAAHAEGVRSGKRSVIVCLAGEATFVQILVEQVGAAAFASRGGQA